MPDDTENDPPEMRVICSDGLTIDCGGYKAVENGIVVTEDEERDRTIAFVPYYKLEYVLPVDLIEQRQQAAAEAPQQQPQSRPATQQPPGQQPIPQQSPQTQQSLEQPRPTSERPPDQ